MRATSGRATTNGSGSIESGSSIGAKGVIWFQTIRIRTTGEDTNSSIAKSGINKLGTLGVVSAGSLADKSKWVTDREERIIAINAKSAFSRDTCTSGTDRVIVLTPLLTFGVSSAFSVTGRSISTIRRADRSGRSTNAIFVVIAGRCEALASSSRSRRTEGLIEKLCASVRDDIALSNARAKNADRSLRQCTVCVSDAES